MNSFIFLLLFVICIGLIYVVHRCFGKHEFYLLTVVYSIISFIMSFKLVTLFGFNVNMGIVFSSGLIAILYYFIIRFDESEIKKYIITVMLGVFACIIFILIGSFMTPSMYSDNLILFKNLFFNNWIILILYPISLLVTLILFSFTFLELKGGMKKRKFKVLLSIIGIIFVDTILFIYFSYAAIIKFSVSQLVAIDNYFIKTIITVIMYLLINWIMKAKKVKS